MRSTDIQKKIVYHVGMPRTGSSFLYAQFSRHPEAYGPPIKELNYFNMHGTEPLAWYYKFFQRIREEKVALDFSPAYFIAKDCISKILELNPDSLFLLGVRRPSEFALSHFKHLNLLSNQKISFKEFFHSEIEVMEPGLGLIKRKPIQPEVIIQNIRELMETLEGQVLVYSYELLEQNPLLLLKEVEKFFGLAPYFHEGNFENIKINSSNRQRSRWVNYLKSKPLLYKSVLKLLPHKLLNFYYNKIASSAVKNVKENVKSKKNKEDLLVAQTLYHEADLFYESLFEKSLILGGKEKEEAFLPTTTSLSQGRDDRYNSL